MRKEEGAVSWSYIHIFGDWKNRGSLKQVRSSSYSRRRRGLLRVHQVRGSPWPESVRELGHNSRVSGTTCHGRLRTRKHWDPRLFRKRVRAVGRILIENGTWSGIAWLINWSLSVRGEDLRLVAQNRCGQRLNRRCEEVLERAFLSFFLCTI